MPRKPEDLHTEYASLQEHVIRRTQHIFYLLDEKKMIDKEGSNKYWVHPDFKNSGECCSQEIRLGQEKKKFKLFYIGRRTKVMNVVLS